MLNNKQFLVNSEHTGRFIVTSYRTGKKYYIEPIDDGSVRTDWGSFNPSTGNIEVKKGWDKYQGAVHPKDSLVTNENGFEKIHNLGPGESPLGFISDLDAKYPTIENYNKLFAA